MRDSRHAYIVVFGNEKGGSGKTTTAVHLVAALLRAGYSVASVDLDGRQRSLTRYMDNRRATMEADGGQDLSCPDHHVLTASIQDSARAARIEDNDKLANLLSRLMVAHDFIVIDCPGSDAHLSRAAHRLADTLVTPLNDSLLDLDMMAQVGPENAGFAATGAYASMVLEQRRQRLARGGAGMDWILLRNRMSPLSSRNSVMIRETLEQLSKVVGCRIADGVTERVIFRQLFLCGLTVFDLPDDGDARRHAACEDIRNLLHSLRLPDPSRRLRQL